MAGIVSSLVASRFGAPLLLVFLVIGMILGEDGLGGVDFDNYAVAYLIGSFALAVILFDGGLRTKLMSLRGALAPASLLATAGVLLTAGIMALAAAPLLGLTLVQGLLLGSIVASTDAAAVFFLLQAGGLRLRPRITATLEVESGTNDPVAIFMTVLLVELLLAEVPATPVEVVLLLLREASVGILFGALGGTAAAWLLNRVELPVGMHPLFVVASAVFIYAATGLAHGSGFLAVYLAGLMLGNRPVRAIANVISFHDTITWLCQIVMFLVLGLLVTPSRMLDHALPAVAVAFVLMLVARPVAVWLCLAPFRYPAAEKTFVAWVGLRGAVSIFLATIPMLSGLPAASTYFDVAFVVVLISLTVQGWTINIVAKRLGLALPTIARPVYRVELDLPGQLEQEMVGYPITAGSHVLDRGPLPAWARLVLVIRDNRILDPAEAGVLREGDYAYLLAPPRLAYRLDRLFAVAEGARPQDDLSLLPLRGDTPLVRLRDLYGLPLPDDKQDATIAQLFAEHFNDQPEPGDRLRLETATLIVQKVEEQQVLVAALLLDDLAGSIVHRALFDVRSRRPRWFARRKPRGDGQAAP
ncbi:potassium/proton antiporter [Marinivivus vitaminiproducens]|uniref:potassium/proton antiporter n=1 Tax=Marinivivus vitaminiproducens TaxID=3035935 RepID=UPI003FA0D5B0